jgi:hypothetical protein
MAAMRSRARSVSSLVVLLAGVAPAVAAGDPPPAARLERLGDVRAMCAYSECAESRAAAGVFDTRPATVGEAHPRNGSDVSLPDAIALTPPYDALIEAAALARAYAHERASLLMSRFTVRVPSSAFTSVAFDADGSALLWFTSADLPLFGGAARLLIDDTTPIATAADPDLAAELLMAHSLGALDVEVTFRLASSADPFQPLCGDSTAIAAADIEVMVVDEDDATPRGMTTVTHVRVSADESLAAAPPASRALPYDKAPRSGVTRVEAGAGVSPDELALVQLRLETALDNCYLLGLGDNPSMTGVLVASLTIDEHGRVHQPTILIDGLDHRDVAACAVAAMDRVWLERPPHAAPLDLRVELQFAPSP